MPPRKVDADAEGILRRKFLTATAVIGSTVAITAHKSAAGTESDDISGVGKQPYVKDNNWLEDELVVNVKKYGVRGDGSTDDTEAINTLFQQLGTKGIQRVYFPPGQYRHAGISVTGKSGFEIFGPGELIALAATVTEYVKIDSCTDFKLLGLQSRHEKPMVRRSTPAHAFSIVGCTNFEISGCHAHRGEGVGIMLINSSHAVVRSNRVVETKADGIGLYGDTHHVTVADNTTYETLDDGIAQVGVTTQGTRPHDNKITGNSVTRSYARGIAVVGAYNSTIIGNTLEFTRAGGIYVASEPTRSTYGCANVIVSGNVILGSNAYNPIIDQAAITVVGEAQPVEDVTITDNQVKDARTEGIRVGGASPGTRRVTLNGNRVLRAGSTGLEMWSVEDISVIGNVFTDLGSSAILGTSDLVGAVVVAGNSVRNSNSTESANTAIGISEASKASVVVSANTIIGAKNANYGIDAPPQATVYGNDLNGAVVRGGEAGTIELRGNVSVSTSPDSADAAGAKGVIAIRNTSMAPTRSPAHGGILYVEDGALKYKGGSGTVTILGQP